MYYCSRTDAYNEFVGVYKEASDWAYAEGKKDATAHHRLYEEYEAEIRALKKDNNNLRRENDAIANSAIREIEELKQENEELKKHFDKRREGNE